MGHLPDTVRMKFREAYGRVHALNEMACRAVREDGEAALNLAAKAYHEDFGAYMNEAHAIRMRTGSRIALIEAETAGLTTALDIARRYATEAYLDSNK